MKSKGPWHRLINGTVFPYDILVVGGMPIEDVPAYTKKELNIEWNPEEIKEMEGSQKGITVHLPGRCTLMWLGNPLDTVNGIGTLVHEAYHATCAVHHTMGARPHDDSEEFWAYHIQHIVQSVLR